MWERAIQKINKSIKDDSEEKKWKERKEKVEDEPPTWKHVFVFISWL